MDDSPEDPTRIEFAPSFIARLERLVGRVAAARGRCEDTGGVLAASGGDEFVGHRPYRPGDELRDLDWNLLARFDEPFVRVQRRGAGERWAILLDTSASMGLGRPAKLQRAAEVVCGLAFVGLAQGARVQLHVAGPALTCGLNRRAELASWMNFVGGLRAAGAEGLGSLLERALRRDVQRVFLVGDLFDLRPEQVAALARPGVELEVVRLLAPRELEPELQHTDVEWVDPETDEHLGVALDGDLRRRYERALTAHLESWRAICARHRIGHGVWSTARPFEDVVRGVLFQ